VLQFGDPRSANKVADLGVLWRCGQQTVMRYTTRTATCMEWVACGPESQKA